MTSKGAYPKAVSVSAPGKVLLFGEHAVVYGRRCVAAALSDLRLHVSIECMEVHDGEACIDFVMEGVANTRGNSAPEHLERSVPMADIRNLAQGLEAAAEVLARMDALLPFESEEDANMLRPAIFLCSTVLGTSRIVHEAHKSLRIRTQCAGFPIGAGLGSSAALCVALGGALVQFRDDYISAASTDKTKWLDTINSFALAGEVILHGTPSGVDNTVATFGGMLAFQRRPTPTFTRLTASRLPEFRFLVVDTRVPRSTKELVDRVRQRRELQHAETEQLFDRIDAIAQAFVTQNEENSLQHAQIGEQMEENHAILNALGVGHEKIERVAQICKQHGMWTKLTGAGGGGCTISLIPSELSSKTMDQVVTELETQGFACFISSVGGDGFRIDSILD